MRTYKLIVATAFRDIHTNEKYSIGTELNVSEERAFELFSSPSHLVRLVSYEGNEDVETIKAENDTLKAEIETLNKKISDLEKATEEAKTKNNNKEEKK